MDSTNPPPQAPLPVSRFAVVLVEPQGRDNIGHAARSMLNFGVGEMLLVNTGPIDDVTRQRAVHAQAVLNEARHLDTLAEVKKEFDHLVGFAARVSSLDKAHRRMSEPLPDIATRLEGLGGRVALVFGREDFGLSNEDVELCDILCTIPTSPSYRSMNLSHAISVALYEITRESRPQTPYMSMMTPHEKEVLFATWQHLTVTVGFQPHKREQSMQMFQRVIGRAGLTAWEYHRMMGVFSRMLKARGAWPPPGMGAGQYTPPPEDETPG